jgi:hypothetical protein
VGFNAGLCTNCETPARERFQTVTGRLLCQRCADQLLGASAALIAGGGIGEAIATVGWLSRLRGWRREQRGREASAKLGLPVGE